jgi:membrane protease YdiL (CAAX protease family)
MYLFAPRLMLQVGPLAYMLITEICFLAMAFVVLAVVVCWERESLLSIGFRSLTWREGLLAVLLAAFLFLLVPILSVFTERVVGIPTRVMEMAEEFGRIPIWLRILLAFRAGFMEEILCRGYPIERLNRLAGRIWPGALISLFIFTILHLPGSGLGSTVGVVLPVGAILTGLYVWKRNLTLNIAVHFLVDLLALVLLPLLPFLS